MEDKDSPIIYGLLDEIQCDDVEDINHCENCPNCNPFNIRNPFNPEMMIANEWSEHKFN